MESTAEPSPGVLSLFEVLFSPTKVFRCISAKPVVAAPLIILMLVSLASGILLATKIDFEDVIRKQLANNPQFATMSKEKREEAIDQAVTIGSKAAPIFTIGGAVLMPPLVYLAIALLFWVRLKVLGGRDWGFKAALSSTLHGFAPTVVAALLMSAVILASDPGKFNIEQPLASNAAALTTKEAVPPFVFFLLQSIDLFSFWTMALLIVGYKAVAKVSAGTAAGSVLCCWLVYVLAKSGLAALFTHVPAG